MLAASAAQAHGLRQRSPALGGAGLREGRSGHGATRQDTGGQFGRVKALCLKHAEMGEQACRSTSSQTESLPAFFLSSCLLVPFLPVMLGLLVSSSLPLFSIISYLQASVSLGVRDIIRNR